MYPEGEGKYLVNFGSVHKLVLTCNFRFATTRWTATTDLTRPTVTIDHDAVPIRIVVTVSFYNIGEFNHQIFRLL